MLSSNWAMFRFHLSLYLGSRPMPQQQSGLAPPWTLTSRPWMPSTTSWLKSWRRERGITSTKSGYPASGSNGDTNLQTSFHNMHANPMNLFIPQGPLPSQVVGKSWKSHERFHLRVPQQHLTKTYNIKFTCILFPARVFFKWLPQPGAPKWRPTKPRFGQHLKAQNQKKPSKVAVHHSPCESGGGSTSECSWWSVATNKKVRNILILQISSVFPRSAKRHFKKKEVEAKVEQWAQNQRFDALPGNLGVPNFSGCHGWNTIGTITILFGMRYIDANPNSWVKSICLRHGTSAVWS